MTAPSEEHEAADRSRSTDSEPADDRPGTRSSATATPDLRYDPAELFTFSVVTVAPEPADEETGDAVATDDPADAAGEAADPVEGAAAVTDEPTADEPADTAGEDAAVADDAPDGEEPVPTPTADHELAADDEPAGDGSGEGSDPQTDPSIPTSSHPTDVTGITAEETRAPAGPSVGEHLRVAPPPWSGAVGWSIGRSAPARVAHDDESDRPAADAAVEPAPESAEPAEDLAAEAESLSESAEDIDDYADGDVESIPESAEPAEGIDADGDAIEPVEPDEIDAYTDADAIEPVEPDAEAESASDLESESGLDVENEAETEPDAGEASDVDADTVATADDPATAEAGADDTEEPEADEGITAAAADSGEESPEEPVDEPMATVEDPDEEPTDVAEESVSAEDEDPETEPVDEAELDEPDTGADDEHADTTVLVDPEAATHDEADSEAGADVEAELDAEPDDEAHDAHAEVDAEAEDDTEVEVDADAALAEAAADGDGDDADASGVVRVIAEEHDGRTIEVHDHEIERRTDESVDRLRIEVLPGEETSNDFVLIKIGSAVVQTALPANTVIELAIPRAAGTEIRAGGDELLLGRLRDLVGATESAESTESSGRAEADAAGSPDAGDTDGPPDESDAASADASHDETDSDEAGVFDQVDWDSVDLAAFLDIDDADDERFDAFFEPDLTNLDELDRPSLPKRMGRSIRDRFRRRPVTSTLLLVGVAAIVVLATLIPARIGAATEPPVREPAESMCGPEADDANVWESAPAGGGRVLCVHSP